MPSATRYQNIISAIGFVRAYARRCDFARECAGNARPGGAYIQTGSRFYYNRSAWPPRDAPAALSCDACAALRCGT